MTRREANLALLSSAALAAIPSVAVRAAEPTVLPPPRNSGGKPRG